MAHPNATSHARSVDCDGALLNALLDVHVVRLVRGVPITQIEPDEAFYQETGSRPITERAFDLALGSPGLWASNRLWRTKRNQIPGPM